MRQAIVTRYAGPTDYRGARVIARCEAGRMTVPWDHALDVAANHEAAAVALARRLGWTGRLVGGGTSDGYAFVFVDGDGDGVTL